MKGICLAAGKATRLYPLTKFGVSKQMLPVYDKPVIFYSLKTLKDLGIKEILVICADKEQMMMYGKLLGTGATYDLDLRFMVQPKPVGLPDAFRLGEAFIGNDDVTLILGDNIFISNKELTATPNTIFTFEVQNPSLYGVATLKEDGSLDQVVEKPKEFISNKAVVGLYVLTNKAVEVAKQLKPSARGELEIVDLILELNKVQPMKVETLDGFWFDVGDFDSLLDCANLVRTIENRTNRKLGL